MVIFQNSGKAIYGRLLEPNNGYLRSSFRNKLRLFMVIFRNQGNAIQQQAKAICDHLPEPRKGYACQHGHRPEQN